MTRLVKINGQSQNVDTDDDIPLLWVIRDVVGLTGTKFGCGVAMCGACTVHIDGVAKRSCVTPIASVASAEVTTIEHLDQSPIGRALQRAWLELDVVQCGTANPGN